MEQAYVQVYTGNGKGKTTAALGLALRAVCGGLNVIMLQFIKGSAYSELKAPQFLKDFTIEQLGNPGFIRKTPAPIDYEQAHKGLNRLKEVISSGEYDLVIADELNVAVHMGLLKVGDVLDVISRRSPHTELVITGRNAAQEIIDAADLVTNMDEIKHYYRKGVPARNGIEK